MAQGETCRTVSILLSCSARLCLAVILYYEKFLPFTKIANAEGPLRSTTTGTYALVVNTEQAAEQF